MEDYGHSLFFEAHAVTSNEKDKIRRYFQIKRESGGGDCGAIEEVGENVYRICFKEKGDQQRVLDRKDHTIPLPCRQLHLTVRLIKSSDDPEATDQPTSTESQKFLKTSTKALEKIFKIDIYLMYYLRDNPKAYKALKKQLSAIGCSVELDFDQEEAVVRGEKETGQAAAAEKWEIQVDRVFIGLTDSYVCHHVLDPKQIRILEQDPCSGSDYITVYRESRYSVVVGEVGAVNERIASLEKSVAIRKEITVVEKQLQLVKEEFDREMSVSYPEVKILTDNTMIILEGPDHEVHRSAAKLEELMKRIKEKKLNLPTELLTFIKSSGAISKYQARFRQNLRNPVSLEVGPDLVLSSLSSDALDEAEAAILRDLKVDTVQLQGTAAVPPDVDRVKEALTKAKNEENSRELRVDASFIPGTSGTSVTKVQLVGYSENVMKLKDVLHDYQMNHVGTQEVLNLPHPELVDCFDEVLDLIGMKQASVTIKASHFPYPCLLVSGPRRLVQEVQTDLNATLANLTSETLVLDGPGTQQYFQGKGREDKELVERTCQVLIKEQQRGHCQSSAAKLQYSSICNMSSIRWKRNTTSSTTPPVSKTDLKITTGSLEDEQVNVLVAPMMNRKLRSTKIGESLRNKGGPAMETNFNLIAENGYISPGDVMQVTAPSSVGCSKIFFIECLPWDGVMGRGMQALGDGLKRCLDLCVQQGWCSVAFPVIGPGVALKFPLKEAGKVLTDKIQQFGLSASSGSLASIHVTIKPNYPDSEECYHDVHRHLSLNTNQGGQVIFRSFTSDLDEISMTVGGVKLQLVFGDITNETTDAIVNTTDFRDFETDGVCKDILTVAGPHVKNELRNANVNRGDVFHTRAGSFPCKAILHVCGEQDAGVIEQLVCRILQHCESHQYKSVSIPAICAGKGKLDPGVVAHAILRGINTSTSSSNLKCLINIRLVLIKISVFLAFKKGAMKMFPHAVINTVSQAVRQHPPRADLGILRTRSAVQQCVFLIVGLCRKDVDEAMTKLRHLYEGQCSTRTFRTQDLAGFTYDDVNSLKQLVDVLDVYVEEDQSSPGNWKVSGLKAAVDQLIQTIQNPVL